MMLEFFVEGSPFQMFVLWRYYGNSTLLSEDVPLPGTTLSKLGSQFDIGVHR